MLRLTSTRYQVFLPITLLTMAIGVFSAPSFAEIHQWTDEKGVTHFSEKPPSEQQSTVINVDVPVSASNAANRSKASTDSKTAESIKIVMYGTAWCPYCKKAREYFIKKGLDFVEYDVEKSPSKMRDFKRLGGRGYPLIIIGDDTKQQGFSVANFERKLKKAQVKKNKLK